MRILLIISFSLVFTFQSFAQSKSSTIKLKNGNQLVGEILYYDPSDSLEIKIGTHAFKISSTEVEKIKMRNSKSSINMIKTNRFYHKTSLRLLTNENHTGLSFDYSLIYSLSQKFWMGIGVGIDNYHSVEGRNLYPAFFMARYNLLNKNSTPYIQGIIGYSWNFVNEDFGKLSNKGGLLLSPTFGCRFGSSGLMWDLSIGYRFQKAHYTDRIFNGTSEKDILWRRLVLGIGIIF